MIPVVIYARVSSKDQEREGYSIPAQLKLLHEYARSHDFTVVKEFIDIETAKTAGRKQFNVMVRFFGDNKNCRILLVEKTDRLYRNFKDCVTLEDLDLEIHLPKEGQIISKNSKSQAKLAHGIQVVMARNYIENLREEVNKGLRQKAEQGIFPGRAPLGYRNNKTQRTIEIHPETAPLAKRLFELYGAGGHSLATLRKTIAVEFGKLFSKGYLDHTLKNPFYAGSFYWQGKLFQATHTPLISRELFQQVQVVLSDCGRPRSRKHQFAFRGLLQCAYDGCTVTAESHQAKYIYYRCTGYRGKCPLPYFREGELAERLGRILKDIHIPDGVLAGLTKSLMSDTSKEAELVRRQRDSLQHRLSSLRRRIDQAYSDKLDGTIDVGFWERKRAEWQVEEQQIMATIQASEAPKPGRILDAVRILELANKAYSLYVRQNSAEQAKLLRLVLSNCAVDAVSLYPTYRKPFDLIFKRVQTEEWLGFINFERERKRLHAYQSRSSCTHCAPLSRIRHFGGTNVPWRTRGERG